MPAIPSVGGAVVLDAAMAHHLDVLRIAPGERIEVFDGNGMAAVAERVDGATVRVVEPAREARPSYRVHLVVALAKGPAMDAALRMAVEAGATDVHPVLAQRSVPRGDRGERWDRIALSAAQQCGRGDVPQIHEAIPAKDVWGRFAEIERRIALPGAPRLGSAGRDVAVAIGPEGGFAPDEVRSALEAGWQPMGLGEFVLRVETACAVAVAISGA